MVAPKNIREVYPSTGSDLTAKNWMTEAPMRMLMNNLHPGVAENPYELVVYGGIGRAARSWQDLIRLLTALKSLRKTKHFWCNRDDLLVYLTPIRMPRAY